MEEKEDFRNQIVKPSSLRTLKAKGQKITCLTAYDYRTAQILDKAGIDIVLVGDSLANVFLGYDSTTQVGMTEMTYHTKAVAKGIKRALLVTDMPFLSYNLSIEKTISNAAELIKAGAKAVKIEGGNENIIKAIESLHNVGIPVIGHLGYTPQSEGVLQSRLQGKTENERQKIFEQSKKVEEAGAIALVLEMLPKDLAKEISHSLKIPTIGIGAGPDCDGQILVTDDLIGKSELKFKFVKRYAEIGQVIEESVTNYVSDVQKGNFPDNTHSFSLT
ncbi:MAG: 3-methyl-2-oxobutanoate hydroxymethyltransferase [Candidatus Caenarcaniphilales bacterium]|nr:3-methyl-2-oxobutanoate hydroxymethyltransferase [Candidatus Caenarcaniphilales bacterium]